MPVISTSRPRANDRAGERWNFACSAQSENQILPSRNDTTTQTAFIQFALYEAYGTRPYEWGSDPDRQKANTKEEETDLGLLNEGMRYRDLETGTFLTRDPLDYEDGPNIYCYVSCNPITKFDPFGLFQFGSRPLDGGDGPWIPVLSRMPYSTLDLLNIEVSHEHGFFEDGSGDNIGWGPNGRFLENPEGKGYRYHGKHYDDALMRQALKRMKDRGKYSLLGKGSDRKYNCQDWARQLRREYRKLEKEQKKNKNTSKGNGSKSPGSLSSSASKVSEKNRDNSTKSKPKSQKTESPQPEQLKTPQSKSKQPESPQPKTPQSESSKTETAQSDSPQAESPQPIVQDETVDN